MKIALRSLTALSVILLAASNASDPRAGKVLLVALVLALWAASESRHDRSKPQGPHE